MSIKIKKIEVVPYNPDWPKIFEDEAALIRQALGAHCLAVHHIGSTSVPGLSAKPYLDVMCVVDDLSAAFALQEIGYVFKGEYNIPLRFGFTKKSTGMKVNLHVVESDHGFIPLNLCFRDYLKTHEESRREYENLKKDLLTDPKSHEKRNNQFSGYNLGKDRFIKEVLEKAGFKDLILNICMHDLEWEAYDRICQGQGIKAFDRNHLILTAENHYHFVLYMGTRIVCVCHLEILNENEAILRSLATDEPYKGQSYEDRMMKIIGKWTKRKGIQHLAV